MTEPRVVCVLGMHRSGTSVVTRLLNLLGVHLGSDEHLMPETPNNARGYWEHQQLTDLDDDVLARVGGSWHDPPPISSDSFSGSEFADLRRRARVILTSDFGDASLWGWKDPRTCLVLPFWQRLVPSIRYVICVRDPMDIARSLARSDGVDGGLDLWVRYMRDSLEYTLGKPRLFVFYEDVLDDWRGELGRLATFIGAEKALEPARRSAARQHVVERELAHHRSDLASSLDDPRIGFPAKALHLALLLSCRSTTEALPHGVLETFATAALETNAQRPRLGEQVRRASSVTDRDQDQGEVRRSATVQEEQS